MKRFRPTPQVLDGPSVCQCPGCERTLPPTQSLTQARLYCDTRCRDRAAKIRAGEVIGSSRVLVDVARVERVPASYREPVRGWSLHLTCGHTVARNARLKRPRARAAKRRKAALARRRS